MKGRRRVEDTRLLLTRKWWGSLAYYSSSIFTLVGGCTSLAALWRLLAGRGPVLLEMAGGSRFVVRTALDAWVVKETVLDRVYEARHAVFGETWIIVDLGAGIGDFTVVAARHAPAGTVHAYEPSASAAALLRSNLELNAVTNAVVHEQAVSTRSGPVVFGENTREGVMSRVAAATAPGAEGATGTVHAVSLAEVLDALPEGRCDFLKMDCEGSEFAVLLAADATLLTRIDRIALEYHDFAGMGHHRELVAHLSAHGHSVVVAESPVYRELGYLYSERVDAAAGRG